MRTVRKPIVDLIVDKTYVDQQRMLDATQPKGPAVQLEVRVLVATRWDLLPAMLEQAAAVTSRCLPSRFFSSTVPCRSGARTTERWEPRRAVDVARAGSWPADDPRGPEHEAWVRATWARIRPFSTGAPT
jgi:hypothetical protein